MSEKRFKAEIYRDARKEFRWRVRAPNGRIVADGAPPTRTRTPRDRAITHGSEGGLVSASCRAFERDQELHVDLHPVTRLLLLVKTGHNQTAQRHEAIFGGSSVLIQAT